jgi:orotidine-5'-phosphate decarboxylase
MNSSPSFAERLDQRMRSRDSLVCVGLDPVPGKLPTQFGSDAASVVRFCLEIIEATHRYVAAYKPNLAFFTQLGRDGLHALWDVRQAIPADVPVILDCKVGDVEGTARAYARGWYDEFGFDAITVNPYLGEDSLAPFLGYAGKGVIVICKTSNPGSGDFQDRLLHGGEPLYQAVATRCRDWEETYPASVGLVVGATYPGELQSVRQRVGDQVILLPGVGAQGGDVAASLRAGLNNQGAGLLCSASRSVLFASSGDDFAQAAETVTRDLRDEINAIRAGIPA